MEKGKMSMDRCRSIPGARVRFGRLTVADCTGMIPILDLSTVHGEL